MKKIAIISGADKKYYPFLKNLIMSLEKTKCLEIADLCILDVEKDSSYLDEVSNYIHNIKKAKFSLKLSFSDAKNWFKLLTERPFIKDYFPGYENYIWLDADTEVLSIDAIRNLAEATNISELAIAPEVNESYVFNNTKFGIKKIFSSIYKISGWSFKNYNKYFRKGLGEDLFFKPLFNNGVFCLKSETAIWNLWKAEYQGALDKAKSSYGIKTDQLSLNKIIYENFTKVSIMDSTSNWIIQKGEDLIKLDNLFLTPSFPRRKINILHYTNLSDKDYFYYRENGTRKKIPII
ncbi:hypothetical protein OAB65_00455 [bacterium]|jgi:hypothetical protein|nr:hypothetical protein [bacterium]|tara:strand:- start:707 stop:1582 length:876 start_codon:yes stop_codon:yes gene_type:complete